MSLRHSYALIAPFYDAAIAAATQRARQQSLAALPATPARVLLCGIGTGLDLPYLPAQHRYTGIDLTEAMLRRAVRRPAKLDIGWVQGDVQKLPFADGSFEHAILHLILAVVPEPAACLAEAARVVAPGGSLLVFDKFLHPAERAPLRRLLNPLTRRLATRLDVVFEAVLARTPGLELLSDRPALAAGWFRLIHLRRAACRIA